ncbi:zinc-ribbon domain-containing protein [Oscillibacter sp.]|uniref:zinc-ribbon domain-containing protein n=1 Tax=Oscillibacter sp. TaxID=1945593 RepID=UPI00260E3B34|nr:zinc-ribbon domain-containing protein [Oscillibacter sp.]MDD3346873.1 zinc-ribbon domain-containing protein [Oscillibacter sp.]
MSLKSYCEASGKQSLLTQWDAEKNLPLTPETVGHASGKPVWWRCEQGHSWQTQVHSRAAGATGCPVCNALRLAQRRNRKLEVRNS